MNVNPEFASLASLIGEPVRATILWNLSDGRAYTATELAMRANVSPQSASMHLSKLAQSNLLAIETQGRYRYYRLANAEVAFAIEALASLISSKREIQQSLSKFRPPNDARYCRTCYDHLAGTVGVTVT
ncbi:MAG: ArsR/SmtB family transcription factor, partial [Pyrinomonadaceae bacterium]